MSKSKLVKVQTERGWEIWPDTSNEPVIAVFTKEVDADVFIARQSVPDAQRIALKITEAYPQLNLSDAPINPNGELVLNIARIISQHWIAKKDKS